MMVRQQPFECHSSDLETMSTRAHSEYRCGRAEAWPAKRSVCVVLLWVDRIRGIHRQVKRLKRNVEQHMLACEDPEVLCRPKHCQPPNSELKGKEPYDFSERNAMNAHSSRAMDQMPQMPGPRDPVQQDCGRLLPSVECEIKRKIPKSSGMLQSLEPDSFGLSGLAHCRKPEILLKCAEW
eukprot:6199532-Pleurochrysis_carterae.AAC.1